MDWIRTVLSGHDRTTALMDPHRINAVNIPAWKREWVLSLRR